MGKTFKRNRKYKTRRKRLYGGRIRKRRVNTRFSKRVKMNYLSKKTEKSRRFKKRTNKKMYGGMFGLEPMYPQLKETLTSMGNEYFVKQYENLDKPEDRYDEACVQIEALEFQKHTRHRHLLPLIYYLIYLWNKEIERLEKYIKRLEKYALTTIEEEEEEGKDDDE